jgi:hypothetical protein
MKRCLKHSWKPFYKSLFSSSVTFLIMTVAAQKHCLFMIISVKETGKNQVEPGQESMGDSPVSSHCLLRNSWPKLTGVPEHCLEGETNHCFPFFREFPSDCIPKAMKDINVRLFIHSFTISLIHYIIASNSSKLYSKFRGLFVTTTYYPPMYVWVFQMILFLQFRWLKCINLSSVLYIF